MITTDKTFMRIELVVAPAIEIGTVCGTNRRCIPIVGGVVTGSYQGEVLNGGADWQRISDDGTIEVDARYVLRLADGLVEIRSRGLRAGPSSVLEQLARGETVDPAHYYFRTAMRFSTAAPALERLNRILVISRGERMASAVRLTVYEVT